MIYLLHWSLTQSQSEFDCHLQKVIFNTLVYPTVKSQRKVRVQVSFCDKGAFWELFWFSYRHKMLRVFISRHTHIVTLHNNILCCIKMVLGDFMGNWPKTCHWWVKMKMKSHLPGQSNILKYVYNVVKHEFETFLYWNSLLLNRISHDNHLT